MTDIDLANGVFKAVGPAKQKKNHTTR